MPHTYVVHYTAKCPRGSFWRSSSSLMKYSSLQNFAPQTLAILPSLDFQLLLLRSGFMCHCLKTPSRSKPHGTLAICLPSLKYHSSFPYIQYRENHCFCHVLLHLHYILTVKSFIIYFISGKTFLTLFMCKYIMY